MGIPTTERTMAERVTPTPRKLVPDERGRITLGDLAKGVNSFTVTEDNGVITLRPMVEIPRSALWSHSFEPTSVSSAEAAAIQALIDTPPQPSVRLKAAMRRR